ncbi:hypothetical protein BS78_06G021700 [Paspalum vaginatum]|nr:hypothetical protein BS78_06G021700 [Paspalum vaginatum]
MPTCLRPWLRPAPLATPCREPRPAPPRRGRPLFRRGLQLVSGQRIPAAPLRHPNWRAFLPRTAGASCRRATTAPSSPCPCLTRRTAASVVPCQCSPRAPQAVLLRRPGPGPRSSSPVPGHASTAWPLPHHRAPAGAPMPSPAVLRRGPSPPTRRPARALPRTGAPPHHLLPESCRPRRRPSELQLFLDAAWPTDCKNTGPGYPRPAAPAPASQPLGLSCLVSDYSSSKSSCHFFLDASQFSVVIPSWIYCMNALTSVIVV